MKASERELVAKRISDLVDRLARGPAESKIAGARYAEEYKRQHASSALDENRAATCYELGRLQHLAESCSSELRALVDVYLAPKRRRAA